MNADTGMCASARYGGGARTVPQALQTLGTVPGDRDFLPLHARRGRPDRPFTCLPCSLTHFRKRHVGSELRNRRCQILVECVAVLFRDPPVMISMAPIKSRFFHGYTSPVCSRLGTLYSGIVLSPPCEPVRCCGRLPLSGQRGKLRNVHTRGRCSTKDLSRPLAGGGNTQGA